MPKINFIINFFLEILNFKESCNLTLFLPVTRKPDFCQVWYWWLNINNHISFHFKTFPEKNYLSVFKYFNYLLSRSTSEKSNQAIPEKNVRLTDGQTADRQTTLKQIGSSLRQRFNKSILVLILICKLFEYPTII